LDPLRVVVCRAQHAYYYIANVAIGLVVKNIIITWYNNLEDLMSGNC